MLVAVLFVAVLSTINFIHISESLKTNLLLILGIGVLALSDGSADVGRPFTFSADTGIALAVLTGASMAFYALVGFEDSANVAAETRDPGRTFPRALFGGILITGIVYLLVAFTATMIIDPARLAGEETAPLSLVITEGPLAFPSQIFDLIALVAITNTALANLIMAPRTVLRDGARGRDAVVPRPGPQGAGSPWVAIVFVAVILLALVTSGDVGNLADTTFVLLLLAFTVVNIVVLALKRYRVDHSHFSVPSFIPVPAMIAIVVLLLQQEADIFLRAGILLVSLSDQWFSE